MRTIQISAALLLAMFVATMAPSQEHAAPSQAAAETHAWWPKTGSIVLAGGGLQKDTAGIFLDHLIALAGGPDANIVVIPTATLSTLPELPASRPMPSAVEDTRKFLESRGAKHVSFLHTLDRKVADSPNFVKDLRAANAVFMTGGAFHVLEDTYNGTLAAREIKAVLERGGVLAGDSAGAIMIGCFWLGGKDPSTQAVTKMMDALCALPDVTAIPHLDKFKSSDGSPGGYIEIANDILTYATDHPGTIGIGIQENTFVTLQGSQAEVFGKGKVMLVDAAKDKTKPYLYLSAGDRRDLAK